MLFALLRSYAIWLLVSAIVCVVGVCLTLIFDAAQARIFLVSYLYHWDGLLVAMAGYGALHFSITTFKQQFHFLLFGILNISGDFKISISHELDKLFSFSNKQVIATPILIVGTAILYICGYPMMGVPKYYLWLASSSMFYAGGLMLAYTIYSLHIFHCLEQNIENIDLQDNVNIVELENFNLYLSILFLAATVALYCAFRGTLTANFTLTPPHEWIGKFVNLFVAPGGSYASVRNLLLYPIVLFLPLSLFGAFYMKLVLRKIYLSSIKRKIAEIDRLAQPIIDDADSKNSEIAVIEVRKAAMELKEKVIQNNKVLPLITLKDSPSIALIIVVILQFIWINDRHVNQFFEGLIGTTN